MHKNELKLSFLFLSVIILITLCFIKNEELCELNQKRIDIVKQQEKITVLSDKISESSFNFKKKRESFIGEPNIKNIIEKVSRKAFIKKIKMKKKFIDKKYCKIFEIEIQFSTKFEKRIYYFIADLQKQLNVIFDSIRIIADKSNNFLVKINCRCFWYDFLGKNIHINPFSLKKIIYENKQTENLVNQIHLFHNENHKKHTLRGIIENQKAYIDNEWKIVGDTLTDYSDDYLIKDIFFDSILIENLRENKILKIKLGDSW